MGADTQKQTEKQIWGGEGGERGSEGVRESENSGRACVYIKCLTALMFMLLHITINK